MKICDGLDVDDERLADICRRFHITELSVFGSALRDDFGPESDVDCLYVGDPHRSGEPWAIVAFERALADLLGREVDVVEKAGVHWYIRDRVFVEAKPIYVAA